MKTPPQNGPASANPPLERNPAVLEFIRRVSQIEGVRCVVAEPEEDAIHLTTFVTPLSGERRIAIYNIQGDLIDAYPEQLFDFHLRDAARNMGATPEPIDGECFVWGNLDADARRAPESGSR